MSGQEEGSVSPTTGWAKSTARLGCTFSDVVQLARPSEDGGKW